jgi:hypothetical protein
MAIVNYITHEVQLKIVLHGAPGSGRAETLKQLHASSPESKGGLAIPESDSGKPLSFSFAAGPSGIFDGFETRIAFHTLPHGVSEGRALWELLRDADGIVLVADSQWEKLEDNVKCLQAIEEILKKDDSSVEELVFALQYNKRDLPDVAPASYIDFLLNNRPKPAQVFETVATTGENVPAMREFLVEKVLSQFAAGHPKSDTPAEAVAA